MRNLLFVLTVASLCAPLLIGCGPSKDRPIDVYLTVQSEYGSPPGSLCPLRTPLVLDEVFIGEAQDAQVLSVAVRPDQQQWRIIRFVSDDLQKYKKCVRERKICA
jgi:ABC-type Fe3+-citrate transport system substrate-binding protein